MMCYKDMTFCSAKCKTLDCRRQFTDIHASNARRWWKHDPDNAPVAFTDFSDTCVEYKQ
jgi:hypothetical protein